MVEIKHRSNFVRYLAQRKCVCVAAVLLFVGCSPSQVRLERNDLARLQGEPKINVVTYWAPFSVQTSGDLLTTGLTAGAVGVFTGGLGGALVGMHADSQAKAEGRRWVEGYFLGDPALEVRDAFIRALAGQFNFSNLLVVPDALPSDDLKALQEKFGGVTMLDFQTDNWQLLPGPMSTSLYRVMYGVRARFLQVVDGRVVWQGYCSYDGKDSRATLDELKANSGLLLRKRPRNFVQRS